MTEEITLTDIDKLKKFPDNPFTVREDDSLKELAESIKENGIINPIMVIPGKEKDCYEVISGQRRLAAAKLAGLSQVPIRIKEMSRDEAIITMVDCNISQRDVLPSEKAFAYKLKLEAMNRQGKRTDLYPDLTSTQVVYKLNTAEIIGEENNESREKVRRYVRLTNLIKPILDLVDDGRIAISPAVEISFLPKEIQQNIYELYTTDEITPSYAQTKELRRMDMAGTLDYDSLTDLLTVPKPNQVDTIKIPTETISRYFPKLPSVKEMKDFVERAVDFYARHLREKEKKPKNRDDWSR